MATGMAITWQNYYKIINCSTFPLATVVGVSRITIIMTLCTGSTRFALVLLIFLVSFFVVGTMKAVGVFFDDITVSLGTTTVGIGVGLGLYTSFSFLPAPFVAAFFKKCERPRLMLFIGTVMMSSGVLLTAFTPSVEVFAFLLIMSGVGRAILFTSCALILDSIAGEQFNLLFGIGSLGGGLGILLVPVLSEFLQAAYGWRSGMLILGALMTNLIPCSLAVRPKPDPRDTDKYIDEDATHDTSSGQYLDCEMFSDHGPHSISSTTAESTNCEQFDNSTVPSQLHRKYRNEIPSSSKTGNKKKIDMLDKHEEKTKPSFEYNEVDLIEEKTHMLEEDDLSGSEGESSGNRSTNHPPSFSLKPTSCVQEIITPEDENVNNLSLDDKLKYAFSKIRESLIIFQDPCFDCLLLATLLEGLIFTGWHGYLIPLLIQRGLDMKGIIMVTSCATAGNILGRLLVGILTHSLFSPTTVNLALTFVNIFALVCCAWLANLYVMAVTSFVNAWVIGARAVLGSLMARERTSAQSFSHGFAAVELSSGFGAIFGGYLPGLLADVYSDFAAAFKLLAAGDVIIFVVMLLLKTDQCRCRLEPDADHASAMPR